MVLHPPEKSRGEGSSKKRKATESPPLGSMLVLDMLIGLTDEVIWIWEVVHQHGKLLIARLEEILGRTKEERIYLEQDSEEYN